MEFSGAFELYWLRSGKPAQTLIAQSRFYRGMSSADGDSSGVFGRACEFARSDNGQRIIVIVFSVIATIALLITPGTAVAYAFGMPLIFFVPGFVVVRMFFWKGTTPETRFVLSLGLSILVVIVLALVLVLTPIGLTPDSTRASLILFTLAAVAVETFVWKADREGKPFRLPDREPERAKLDIVVAAMLVAALVVSGISLGLIITAERTSRTYFAITDGNGLTINNTDFYQGTNESFILYMKNGQERSCNFTVVVYGQDTPAFGTHTFMRILQKGEYWNQTVSVPITELGYFRLNFDLYIQEGGDLPYLYGNLHLWVSVWPQISVA